MAHFWLSFVNDAGFAGVAVVEASGSVHAVAKAHTLGINPGGEVMIEVMIYELTNAVPPIVEAARAGKLLNRDEAIALNQAVQACA